MRSDLRAPLGATLWATLVVTVLLTAVGCATVEPKIVDPERGLDHFLCYEGRNDHTVGESLQLEDQFDRKHGSRDRAEVVNPIAFCNPVAKSRRPSREQEAEEGEIGHPDHHLVGYQIRTRREQAWSAVFTNQVSPSGQRLHFRRAHFLLVPTRKLAPREHREPRGLDHFKCYLVGDPPPSPGRFELDDQFPGVLREVELTGARAVCAPVHKFRQGRTVEKALGRKHLVCYGVRRDAEQSVRYSNQFEDPGGMRLNRVFGLCVPSDKTGVQKEGQVPEG